MLNSKLFLALILSSSGVALIFGRPLLAASGEAAACEYWVAPAPQGDDANRGTANSPWATLEYAAEVMRDSDCTVWVRPGHYSGTFVLNRRFTTSATFQAAQPYQAVLENSGLVLNYIP